MFNTQSRAAAFILGLLLMHTAEAASFPHGCEVSGFGYRENYLILNATGEQAFYLIQNRSDFQIELQRQETQDVFLSPKLESKLSPLQWAAFASDIQNLYFKCSRVQNNQLALVNCDDVLEVCQYPRVKFALSNMGNYWISTNKPKEQVIKDATAKGIWLRW